MTKQGLIGARGDFAQGCPLRVRQALKYLAVCKTICKNPVSKYD
jgi:hypothetical protein